MKIWPKKKLFFEVWSWFKFNNLGQALVINFQFGKRVQKFWG